MGQILDATISFFQDDNWDFEQISEGSVLSMIFQGRNGRWQCLARTQESPQRVIFYSLCPLNIAEPERLVVAEFLGRANYGLAIGNFEFDIDDGEIRYKTSLDVEGNGLTFALIKRLVYANVVTMDQYLPGIVAVVEHHSPPKAAIQQVESAIAEASP